jgi:hypothetical protein
MEHARLSGRWYTSTGNTGILRMTYDDASKAKDAQLADKLLQKFCTLAV